MYQRKSINLYDKMNESKEETSPLMVTIQCITYNHELYIRQCLEGFVMQQTNFRFEVIVHDDASTDGTTAIIREYVGKYPNIIKPIYETENQYSKYDGSIGRIMSEHTYGKYVAMCEGDDYWIDPLKLQKQVDFLEENPEYGLIYAKVSTFYQNQKKFKKNIGGSGTSFLDILCYNPVPTLTVCFRKNLYDSYVKEILSYADDWKMGDYPLWIYISKHSKVQFMDSVVGVYRVLQDSASHHSNVEKQLDMYDSGFQIALFFQEKYLKGSENIKFHFLKERLWFHFRFFCLRKEWKCIYAMRNELADLKKKDLKICIMKIASRFPPLCFFMNRFFICRSCDE